MLTSNFGSIPSLTIFIFIVGFEAYLAKHLKFRVPYCNLGVIDKRLMAGDSISDLCHREA